MSDSNPPPSAAIPGRSGGSGLYIVGALVFLVLIVGLLYSTRDKGPEPEATPVTQQKEIPPPIEQPPPPPPPPPPIEELDAGSDADAPAAKAGSTGNGKGAPTANGPCSKCGEGKSSSALNSAISAAAQGARGCYNRALRNSEVSGSLTVSVQVGSTGSVCSAAIVNDTVGSSEIRSCVQGKFIGRSFPPPETGCVVVNVPISFTIKQ